MFRDADKIPRLLLNPDSIFCYIVKVSCAFILWSPAFLLTAHAEVVTTGINQSPFLNTDTINPQECNKTIHAASHLPKNQKQHKSVIEASSVGKVKETFRCLTSAENVHESRDRKKNLLIDVRDAKAFIRNKIPGSINIPLYMLEYKEDLKSRNVVLINKGLHLSTLEKSCSELKAKGFERISVMHDGLKAWGDVGYPITGDKMAIQGLSDVTPHELVSVINEREWAFIDMDHSSKELPNLLSPTSVIAYTEDYASLRDRMNAFKAAIKPGVIPGFLVISQDGNRNRIIKRRFLDSAIKDIYYLKGGVSGLKRFMQKHAAQVERLRKGFQVRMGCNG